MLFSSSWTKDRKHLFKTNFYFDEVEKNQSKTRKPSEIMTHINLQREISIFFIKSTFIAYNRANSIVAKDVFFQFLNR